jgi:hypothetical protein
MVKTKPKMIVNKSPLITWFLFPCTKLWWAQVMLTPEDKRIIVLSKGIE